MRKTGFRAHFRRSILTGLAALLPLILTIIVLGISWQFINNKIAKPVNRGLKGYLKTDSGKRALERWFGWNKARIESETFEEELDKAFPGYLGPAIALLITLLFLYLLGWFLASYLGRALYARAERAFSQLPLVKKIYPAAKRVTTFLFGSTESRKKFSRVVAIQYPRPGVYAMGYLTGDGIEALSRRTGKRMINVFVPTSPIPATGFVLFVPEDEVIPLPVTVDESVAFLTTLGVGVPDDRPEPEAEDKTPDALPGEASPEDAAEDH